MYGVVASVEFGLPARSTRRHFQTIKKNSVTMTLGDIATINLKPQGLQYDSTCTRELEYDTKGLAIWGSDIHHVFEYMKYIQ